MTRILIISREELSLLMAVLAEEGHQIVEAYDSGHVLQLVMRQGVDAIVLPDDVEPVDGEELLPVIRRLTAAPIVVVGEGGETKMAEALFRGADAYLYYPDEPGRLRSRLRSLLRPRRVPRPADRAEDRQEDRASFFGRSYFQLAILPAI